MVKIHRIDVFHTFVEFIASLSSKNPAIQFKELAKESSGGKVPA